MEKYLKEIRSRVQQVNQIFKNEKEKKIQEAYTKYSDVLKHLASTQAHLDEEIQKAVGQLKKSATDLEKNLKVYKTKAQGKIQEIEGLLIKKAKSSMKRNKTRAKKTSKKTTRKKTTTKKATT